MFYNSNDDTNKDNEKLQEQNHILEQEIDKNKNYIIQMKDGYLPLGVLINQLITKMSERNSIENEEVRNQNKKLEQEITEAKNYLIQKYCKQNPNLSLLKLITYTTDFLTKQYIILKKKYDIFQQNKKKDLSNEKFIQEIDKLNEEKKAQKQKIDSLVVKYNNLFQKNHHNYVLIGDMKKIIIKNGNLQKSDSNLGGIKMTEKAFANKEEEIKQLKQQIQNINQILLEKDKQNEPLKKQLEENTIDSSNLFSLKYKQTNIENNTEKTIKEKLKSKGLIEDYQIYTPLETIIDEIITKLEDKNKIIENNQKYNEQIKEKLIKSSKNLKLNKNIELDVLIDRILSEKDKLIILLNKQIVENLDNNEKIFEKATEKMTAKIQSIFNQKYNKLEEDFISIQNENQNFKQIINELETLKQKIIKTKSNPYLDADESALSIIKQTLFEKDQQIQKITEKLENNRENKKETLLIQNQQILINIQTTLQEKLHQIEKENEELKRQNESLKNENIDKNKQKEENDLLIRRHFELIKNVNKSPKQRMKIMQLEES